MRDGVLDIYAVDEPAAAGSDDCIWKAVYDFFSRGNQQLLWIPYGQIQAEPGGLGVCPAVFWPGMVEGRLDTASGYRGFDVASAWKGNLGSRNLGRDRSDAWVRGDGTDDFAGGTGAKEAV